MNENTVLCGQCVTDGLSSTVEVSSQLVTAMAIHSHHDEAGRLHTHDPNWYTTSYLCSRGHWFQSRVRNGCWCGWPGDGVTVGSTEP